MKQPSITGVTRFSCILFFFFFSCSGFSQGYKIDWKKDTMSRADAVAARLNYMNNIKGGGNPNATEQIILPVDKLKEIMDACAAHNVTNVAVFMIKLRQADVAHFRQHNPNASDNDLKGSQVLVFKVPRMAFAGAAGAKTKLPANNPLMLSLTAAGLVLLDYQPAGLPPGAGDVLFSFGQICPPPASCGD